MPLNPDDPTIPLECTDATIDNSVNAGDCYSPTLNFGPAFRNLYYARPGKPLTVVSAEEITRRLALADTDEEQMVGPIICVGTRADGGGGTGNTVRVNGEDIDISAVSSYAVTFQDTNQPNHDMMRRTQAGRVKGHWYGVDQNDKWRGGINGLTGGKASLKLRENLPEDENGLQTFVGTLTGTGKYDDARQESPVPVVFGGR